MYRQADFSDRNFYRILLLYTMRFINIWTDFFMIILVARFIGQYLNYVVVSLSDLCVKFQLCISVDTEKEWFVKTMFENKVACYKLQNSCV